MASEPAPVPGLPIGPVGDSSPVTEKFTIVNFSVTGGYGGWLGASWRNQEKVRVSRV